MWGGGVSQPSPEFFTRKQFTVNNCQVVQVDGVLVNNRCQHPPDPVQKSRTQRAQRKHGAHKRKERELFCWYPDSIEKSSKLCQTVSFSPCSLRALCASPSTALRASLSELCVLNESCDRKPAGVCCRRKRICFTNRGRRGHQPGNRLRHPCHSAGLPGRRCVVPA